LELDLELTDDLKLAVTEACGFLLEHASGAQPISADFTWRENKLTVTVDIKCDETDEVSIPNSDDNLGLFLIHALMDEVETLNHGRTLVLSKDLSRRVDE
jgi:anti-sigma regulatory factor (Ser/Thr protein kinase)